MRLVLHPDVRKDVTDVMEFYQRTASSALAQEFYRELRRSLELIRQRPRSFGCREHELRRINLRRFPYHVLFRLDGKTVRVLVVRHHRRDPTTGADRD